MKIFANENLFDPIIHFLQSLGHEVVSIRESGLSGISDDEVYQMACREKRVIVTMDKDFSRIFRFSPEACGGIIVVKIYRRKVDETLSIFKRYYERINEEDIEGNLIIITPTGLRIRRTRKTLNQE
jgi:predicted nuclease of predicted toxin-antitoxin system